MCQGFEEAYLLAPHDIASAMGFDALDIPSMLLALHLCLAFLYPPEPVSWRNLLRRAPPTRSTSNGLV